MSRIDSLILTFLSRFGIDPAAGDLASEVEPRPVPSSSATVARVSPYRTAPVVWGVEALPAPAAGRRVSPRGEETAVERRRPRSSRRAPGARSTRRQLEALSLPRPRGLVI